MTSHQLSAAVETAARKRGSVGGDVIDSGSPSDPVGRVEGPDESFGTFRYDVRTARMTWSDAIYRIYGFDVAAVLPTLELLAAHQHPDDRAAFREWFRRILVSGDAFCHHHRIVDARRRVRTVMFSGSCIVAAAGQVLEVNGFLTDLTDMLNRHHAEAVTQAILRSAETRATIEQAKGVLMASFEITNEQAFGLLRMHSSTANRKLRDVAAALVEGLAESRLARLAPRQRAVAILGTIGHAGSGESQPSHLVDTSEAPDEAGGRAHPVTRAIAPADLPRTMVRAIALAAQSITIADCRSADQPLVYANPAFRKLTGYPLDEILGRNCRFLQGAETEPGQVAEIRMAISLGHEVRTVLRNYRRDGKPFWNEMHLSGVRDETGQLTHYIGYQVDVSERVEREQQLLALARYDAQAVGSTADKG